MENIADNTQFGSKETSPQQLDATSILKVLDRLCAEFVQKKAADLNKTFQNHLLLPFGSYRVCGVLENDLDVLLIGPSYCKYEDFFIILHDLLLREERIDTVKKVPDARIPVMQMVIDGTQVDLLFCSWCDDNVPNMYVSPPQSFNMDSKSLQSLNGVADAEFILGYVPNVEFFRIVLNFCKTWAKKKLIYSDRFGFLGGISWTVLVAFACKSFPQVTDLDEMLLNFFEMYSKWNWNDKIVYLTKSCNYQINKQKDRMTVMTCSFPYKNTLQHMSHSTKRLTLQQLENAAIAMRTLRGQGRFDRKVLLKEEDFFSTYRDFLKIKISAVNEASLERMIGWFESRMMILVFKLELNSREVRFHPLAQRFKVASSPSINYFIGVKSQNSQNPSFLQIANEYKHPQSFSQFTEWKEKEEGMDVKIMYLHKETVPTGENSPKEPSGRA
eukprot:TRINITY_DN4870_c0_g1_i2.p1 TRINITY_DN4870_c0_g1~~TRINITY_DN4870_c0_g1_i2.p1  ORF type:complete len:470 (-),score=73.87 TRINITY_DN4870_c0_g1_i2:147-1475(-)